MAMLMGLSPTIANSSSTVVTLYVASLPLEYLHSRTLNCPICVVCGQTQKQYNEHSDAGTRGPNRH